uniref:Protein SHORT HYPOCOTYL IN WHITE LIGHT 1 isoform X2 n=1 Tax=Elaeis guineensis var. tenera TaxID=51953 RepID=A0A6I9QEI8_ELAGV|nr:protein SHORT HYPOCOTYL IN WHITE LIGHT 1 isoform X2 [Elaeis guineensis]
MALVPGFVGTAAARSPQLLLLPFSHISSSSHLPNLHYFHPSLRSSLSPFPNKPIKSSKINGVSWEGRGEEGEGEDIEGVFSVDSDVEEGESGEEDEESGLDLLFQFLQSLFRRVSRRATKAARAVLPPVISPQLVSFSVDGILLLTLVSLVKAFLEVLCTLGGSIFIIILLLRVIWSLLSHIQSRSYDVNEGRSGTYNTT